MTDRTPYIFGIVCFPCIGGLAAMMVRDLAAYEDKWAECATQCAPHAPAQVRPACYCDTRTTLPPTKD